MPFCEDAIDLMAAEVLQDVTDVNALDGIVVEEIEHINGTLHVNVRMGQRIDMKEAGQGLRSASKVKLACGDTWHAVSVTCGIMSHVVLRSHFRRGAMLARRAVSQRAAGNCSSASSGR